MRIKDFIHSRTQEEWREFFFSKVEETRSYIQAHGERSALIGFFVGVFIMLFIKLFLALMAVLVIICLGTYLLAETEKGV